MHDITDRLVSCFQTVFPALSVEQIPTLTQANAATWDSVAAITLLNVIEDEFQIQMDLDAIADLDSFERIREYLEDQAAAAP